VIETSKIVDVLLPLGRKQHSCVQGHSFCLHYTLFLMQLSVVRNLILMGCSDDIPMSGLLVIDAVGWRSMYFVVMPRVNLIVILVTYARYLYSINCPTVICLPSILLFILWRDTTSEMWTPVQFPLHCYTVLLLLALFTFSHTTIVFQSIRSILCLQQTCEIDNLIISWEQSTWLCCVQVPRCCWCKAKPWTRRLINCPELSRS
jgi:hypothetical protein